MFWNKEILKEKKEITLVNRILDLIEFDTTEVKINENHTLTDFNYPFHIKGNVVASCVLRIAYNGIEISISYIKKYSTNTEWYYVVDSNNNGVQIEREDYRQIKSAIYRHIERSILVSLYPFKSPELESVFNDVQKIQDGTEQIEFIMKEIHKIKENYPLPK